MGFWPQNPMPPGEAVEYDAGDDGEVPEKPPVTPVPEVHKPGVTPPPKTGTERAEFPLPEGAARLDFPASMSEARYDDMAAWLELVLRRAKRSVKKDEAVN